MKKQGLETVTVEEYSVASSNYMKFKKVHVGADWAFHNFLGSPVDETPKSHSQYLYPADVCRRIRLLAGPHYHAVLKAHYANQKACNHR